MERKINMILSSSNGTRITIDDLEKAWHILHEVYLRIQEINEGSYSGVPSIQFDYCTCPVLANWTDSIVDIADKISKVVYQK